MANPRKRVPENVPGDFFVDSTCIDCDTCRQIAPAVFGEAADTSFVKAQPVSGDDRRQALQALLACPTGSIGCLGGDDPKAVMTTSRCSSRSRSITAASTRRSRTAATATSSATPAGNWLIDSPRSS